MLEKMRREFKEQMLNSISDECIGDFYNLDNECDNSVCTKMFPKIKRKSGNKYCWDVYKNTTIVKRMKEYIKEHRTVIRR